MQAERTDLQPMPFRLLVDQAMKQTKRHFRRIYPPYAIISAAGMLVVQIIQLTWFGRFFSDPTAIEADPAAFFTTFALMMLLSLPVGLLYLVLLAAMKVAVSRTVVGGDAGFRACMGFVLRPAVLGTVLLMAVIIVLGFVALALPGIYLTLAFTFVVPVMALEGQLGTGALSRSHRLAVYNPSRRTGRLPLLKILGVYFLGWLLSYAVGLLVQVPVAIVQQVAMFRGLSTGDVADVQAVMAQTMWLSVPAQVLTQLLQIAVMLYLHFAVVLLYVDCRNRIEGRDIEAALDRLERPQSPPRSVPGLPLRPDGSTA